MTTLPIRAARRVRGWLESLPLPAVLVVGILVMVGVSVGGVYAYRTYDFVQHDNDFCVSCHLMEDPFERFARSEHRELGCKACHRPNLYERSTMGLTAVVEDPDSVGVHAEVPNSVCAECHMEGDPTKWELIAASAGHRVHLESSDSVLQGLKCVECHSTSVHEFASVDRTCAQSGCHVESTVDLGAMSDLAIHCAACHAFSDPTPEDAGIEALSAALAPDRETCLTCHEMRLLVALPEPDPHEGICSSCHNPHTQATPAEAAESCAAAGCHTEAAELTPFHAGLEEEVLTDCMYCHQAHDFHVDGADCLACHVGILEDDRAVPRRAVPADSGRATAALSWTGLAPDRATLATHHEVLATSSWNGPLAQVEPPFLHSEHIAYGCTACHQSEVRHGETVVRTLAECRDCHHTEQVSDGCQTCHAESESAADPYHVVQSFQLASGADITRRLPFDHEAHTGEQCASCHTEGLELSAAGVDCQSCHEEHHEPTTSCSSCHLQPQDDAHSVEVAHVTCSGSGCHDDGPFEVVPRTREVCLACHQDLVDHRPGEPRCAECHALPETGR